MTSACRPLESLTGCDDRIALEAAQQQEITLVARGDDIGLAGDGRCDDVIVAGIGGRYARLIDRWDHDDQSPRQSGSDHARDKQIRIEDEAHRVGAGQASRLARRSCRTV